MTWTQWGPGFESHQIRFISRVTCIANLAIRAEKTLTGDAVSWFYHNNSLLLKSLYNDFVSPSSSEQFCVSVRLNIYMYNASTSEFEQVREVVKWMTIRVYHKLLVLIRMCKSCVTLLSTLFRDTRLKFVISGCFMAITCQHIFSCMFVSTNYSVFTILLHQVTEKVEQAFVNGYMNSILQTDTLNGKVSFVFN